MSNFFHVFGNKKLWEVFADKEPVPLSAEQMSWLDLPDEDFLQYSIEREKIAFPYDRTPCSVSDFDWVPTHMAWHAHRLHIHSKIIGRLLENEHIEHIIDLGSFPFSLDIIIRERLGYNGSLLATVNAPLGNDYQALLDELNIPTAMLNLDPLIDSGDDPGECLLQMGEGSVDLVILDHVIEHLYHPMTILQEVSRVLRKGGFIFIGTDNAHAIAPLINLIMGTEPITEHIETTAAMHVSFWRGHNRIFSEGDLRTMALAAGMEPLEVHLNHVIWDLCRTRDVDYDKHTMPRWRATLLTEAPRHRNTIALVARKV